MKQLLPKIVKSTLIGICVILVILLFLPANTRLPEIKPSQTGSDGTELPSTAQILHSSKDIDPGDAAEMFGWIRPTATPTPIPTGIPTAVPAPTCVPAGYLKFITTYKDDSGVKWYIFRDLRNNSTIQITEGKTVDGWNFIEENEIMYKFKRNGVIHCSYK
jgi:hypothetical protein